MIFCWTMRGRDDFIQTNEQQWDYTHSSPNHIGRRLLGYWRRCVTTVLGRRRVMWKTAVAGKNLQLEILEHEALRQTDFIQTDSSFGHQFCLFYQLILAMMFPISIQYTVYSSLKCWPPTRWYPVARADTHIPPQQLLGERVISVAATS